MSSSNNRNSNSRITIKGRIIPGRNWDGKTSPMLKNSTNGNPYYTVPIELSEDFSGKDFYLQADSVLFLFFWEKNFWGMNDSNLDKIKRLRADHSKIFKVYGIIKRNENSEKSNNLMSVLSLEQDELYGDGYEDDGVFI